MRLPRFVAEALSGNRIGARLLRPLVNRMLPRRNLQITVLSGVGLGLKLVVDPQSEKFYWTGAYEPGVQDAVRALLKPGSVFWDVGAHIGYYTLIASRLVGKSGKVIAFEPYPSNLDRLRRGVMLNGAENVDVRAQAVSDTDGTVAFYESESSLMGGLVPVESAFALTVRGTRLDTVATESGPPNLIKVDVEGAELAVLRGASHLLTTHHPTLILELLTDSSRDAAAQLLNGWRFDMLDSRNWLVQVR